MRLRFLLSVFAGLWLSAVLSLTSVAGSVQVPGPPRPRGQLVFEGPGEPHFSSTQGYLELKQGSGWLRMPWIYSNVQVSFDVRLTDSAARAEVVVAPLEGGEIQIQFPGDGSGAQLIRTERVKVSSSVAPDVPPFTAGAWHRFRLRMHDGALAIVVDEREIGQLKTEPITGFFAFRSRKGSVQLRSINAETIGSFPVRPSDIDSIPLATDEGITAPEITQRVEPIYPADARRRGIEGLVILEAVVLPDGRVGPMRLLRPLPGGLDVAAVKAVAQWQFRPATRGGRAIAVVYTAEVNFRM